MKSRQGIENRDGELPDQKYIGDTPVEPGSAIDRGDAPAESERSIDHETTPPPIEPMPPVDGDVSDAQPEPVKKPAKKGTTKK